MPKAQTKKPAAAKVAALPADLQAMSDQVERDDKAARVALDNGAFARAEMVAEIAMLRAQVEALTNLCSKSVACIDVLESEIARGRMDLSPVFEQSNEMMIANIDLHRTRNAFYEPRVMRDQMNEGTEKAVAKALSDMPPFLLGDAKHPSEGEDK